jgi:hypothetical protein
MWNIKKYAAMASVGVGLALAATPASACAGYGYRAYGSMPTSGYGGFGAYGMYRPYRAYAYYPRYHYYKPAYGDAGYRPFARPFAYGRGCQPRLRRCNSANHGLENTA